MVLFARAVLGLVFAAAAIAKLARRDQTIEQFTQLGLRRPATLAWAVPAVETAIAVCLVFAPVVGGGVALFVLVLFTALLISRLRDGYSGPCACFGSLSGRDLSWREPLRNGALALLAGVILLSG